MKVVIVSGLLGVGKTSVILKMLDPLMADGTKVAVIENDFGAMGVDSEVLEKNGMKVRDLKGGCICCTMQGNLMDSLLSLKNEYDPEIVVIEPTGIADPQFIVGSVEAFPGIGLESVHVSVIVDCERFLKVQRMFERPLKNQLKLAKVAMLNKIDTVPPEDLERIGSAIRDLGYDGPLRPIRGDTGEGIPEAIAELMI
jgi:G3E family GTPase